MFTVVFKNARTDIEVGTIEFALPRLRKNEFNIIRSELEFHSYMNNFSDPYEAFIFQWSFTSVRDYILENKMWAAALHVFRYTPEKVYDDGEYAVYGHVYADGQEIRTTGNLREGR